MEEPLEEEEEESIVKKVVIIIISIFLILLILSWALTSYPIGEILQGQAESISIKENKIETEELEIIFLNDTEKVLSTIYNEEQEEKLVESSTCLLGEKLSEDTYIVDSIFYPEIKDQSFRHVRFSSCPSDTLVMLHTHPYKRCIASDTDLETLENTKRTNPDIIMIVMCEEDRYSIYRGDT